MMWSQLLNLLQVWYRLFPRFARRAVAHREALHEVLQTVPESVKPALRQALHIADSNYEEVQKALD